MNSPDKTALHAAAFKQLLLDEGKAGTFPGHLSENFPHIADKIFLLWADSAAINHYFDELLTTNRENRAGFPPEVYSEIFALKALHNEKHLRVQKDDDFWSGVNKRD